MEAIHPLLKEEVAFSHLDLECKLSMSWTQPKSQVGVPDKWNLRGGSSTGVVEGEAKQETWREEHERLWVCAFFPSVVRWEAV